MSELKPCPFCGGEANTLHRPHVIDWRYSVGCNDDECRGFIGLSWLYKTEAEAIAAWNSRAERTCKIESSYLNDFTSNHECWYEFEMQCGYKFTWDEMEPPTYCPNCGARVMGE